MILRKPTKCSDRNPIHVSILNILEHPWHMHEGLEIVYVLQGRLEANTSIYSSVLLPGDVAVVNSQTLHYLRASGDNITLVFHFDFHFFASLFPAVNDALIICNSGSAVAADRHYDVLKENLSTIFLYYYNLEQSNKEELLDSCMACLTTLINHFDFLQHKGSRILSENLMKKKPVQFERLRRIAQYIYEYSDRKITLDDLAKKEFISKYYLSHLMSDGFHMSFQTYLNLVRVIHAQELLYGTNRTISQISAECGFSNTSSFRKIYEQYLGCTPSADRKRIAGHTASDASTAEEDLLSSMNLESVANLLQIGHSLHAVEGVIDVKGKVSRVEIDLSKASETKLLAGWDRILIADRKQIMSYRTYKALKILGSAGGCKKVAVPFSVLNDLYADFENWDFMFAFLLTLKESGMPLVLISILGKDDASFRSLLDYSQSIGGPEIDIVQEKPQEERTLCPANDPAQIISQYLSDSESAFPANLFSSVPYLFEENYLSTPAFYAYNCLNKLGEFFVKRGDGYFVTRTKDTLKIMLFHPNSPNTKKFLFKLKNLNRNYICKIHTLTKYTGDEQGVFHDLGEPKKLDNELRDLIHVKMFPKITLFGIDAAPEYELYLPSYPDTATLVEIE